SMLLATASPIFYFFFLILRPPPRSTLFPYTTLFRSSFRRVAEFFDEFQPELIHVHTEGALGVAGRRYALARKLPLVTSFHTNFPQYSRHYGVGFLEPAVWRWLECFHGPAALTLTPGDGVRDELVRRGVGHAAVWGRGVDTRLFQPGRRDAGWRRWLAGGDDTAVGLHVGRLAREENLVALEAMSSGVGVIAADAGGFRESIRHDVTGLLVPPSDVHAYAEAIIELALDPARRFLLGTAARERALARDVDPENAELLARYAALIGVIARRTAA